MARSSKTRPCRKNVKRKRKPYTKGALSGAAVAKMARDVKKGPTARITTPGYNRRFHRPKGAVGGGLTTMPVRGTAFGGRIRSGYSPAVMPPARGMKAGGTVHAETMGLMKELKNPNNPLRQALNLGKLFGSAIGHSDSYKRRMGHSGWGPGKPRKR